MRKFYEAQKVSLAFDRAAGDRITISGRWLRDKAKLTPQDRGALQRFLRTWERRGGEDFPIFEPKKRKYYMGHLSMAFGVELQKREPPIHAIVFVLDADPDYGKPKDPDQPKSNKKTQAQGKTPGKLFVFDRVFDNYDEYYSYLNDTLKSAKS